MFGGDYQGIEEVEEQQNSQPKVAERNKEKETNQEQDATRDGEKKGAEELLMMSLWHFLGKFQGRKCPWLKIKIQMNGRRKGRTMFILLISLEGL